MQIESLLTQHRVSTRLFRCTILLGRNLSENEYMVLGFLPVLIFPSRRMLQPLNPRPFISQATPINPAQEPSQVKVDYAMALPHLPAPEISYRSGMSYDADPLTPSPTTPNHRNLVLAMLAYRRLNERRWLLVHYPCENLLTSCTSSIHSPMDVTVSAKDQLC